MRTPLLFCCFLLLVGSHAISPGMRHLLAINTAGWPTEGNCSMSDPTEPCDKIVEDYTGNDNATISAALKVFAKYLYNSAKLITGDKKFGEIKPDLCTSAQHYRTCVAGTLTKCGGAAKLQVAAKRKSVLLLSKNLETHFCGNRKDLENKLKNFDIKKCFSSKTMTAVDFGKQLRSTVSDLAQNGECNAAITSARNLITRFLNLEKACTQKGPELINFIVLSFVRPDLTCDLKKFKIKPSATDRGNPKSKIRKSSQYISLNHLLVNVQKVKNAVKDYITCADENRNASLFEWDLFSVKCDLMMVNDAGISNTQCRRVCFTLRDSQYDVVSQTCLSANSSFEGKGKTIKKGKQKKGGNLEQDVKITANANKVMYHEKNSGTFIIVRRNFYTPAGSSDKIYLLIITLRASDSVIENSSGFLTKGCDATKDIVAAVKSKTRRKRATSSAVADYDVKSTGDPNAKSFEAQASSDAESAESEDSSFINNPGHAPTLMPLPILMLTALMMVLVK